MSGSRHRRPAARPSRPWRHMLPAALLLLALAAPGRAAAPAPSVLTYHADPARSGHYVAPDLTWTAAAHMHRDRRFDGRVPGAVYAQPLFWNPPGGGPGRVIVATEADVVMALDAATGRPVWQTRLGPPVRGAALPCTNIDPLGITGTPVIDPAAGAIYLDAMVAGPHGPQQEVFGLRLADGAVLQGWPIDVHTALAARGIPFITANQNQRTALALLDGRVFLGYGGLAGDCGDYHGTVLGFDTAKPHLAAAWVTRGKKGGVWSPGGISVANGRLFFVTGNTDDPPPGPHPAAPWGDGEGVFRETPALAHSTDPHDFFAPANYRVLNTQDLDLGGTVPLPIDLPDGTRRLVAMGKDGKAYLLDRDDLGGIGGALAVRQVAAGPIITAPVVYRSGGQVLVAFRAPAVLCPGGSSTTAVEALAVTAAGLRPVWCAPLDGRGIPIVTTSGPDADPIVWVAGAEGDGRLRGYRGDTGRPVFTSPPLPGLRHFVTPLVAGGRLYLAGDGRVFAFTWDAAGEAR
ncbi:MAG: PQQ-binding-like beta-propeller repeat protein [Proteobacteria bacterium]|nr:PQQ-binding-like beta-propeller repeat protein [Pseudomonadota bacterium]